MYLLYLPGESTPIHLSSRKDAIRAIHYQPPGKWVEVERRGNAEVWYRNSTTGKVAYVLKERAR